MKRGGVLLIALAIGQGQCGENVIRDGQRFASLREHSVILTSDGPIPNHFSLFVGEKLRLFVATTEKGEVTLAIPSHDVLLGVAPGQVSSAEVVFREAGRYHYHGLGKDGAEGTITVLQRRKPRQHSRIPASEGHLIEIGDQWMPREF